MDNESYEIIPHGVLIMNETLGCNGNRLTICIPTFNRFEKLTRQVASLLSQLNDSERLIIIDNATPGNCWEKCDEIFNDPRISICINSNNIGLTGNLLKCLDVVQHGWMWLLSDDETILSNALNTIRNYINHTDADFINFKCEMARGFQADRLCNGIDNYLSEIKDDFGNHLLISNNVFNVAAYKKYMKFAYWGCYTNAPHIAPVIMALNHNANILLSSSQIVSWTPPLKNESWRMVSHFSIIYLADLLSNSRSRIEMIRILIRSLPALEVLVAQLAYNIISNPDDKSKIIDYSNRIFDIYIKHGSFKLKMKAKLLRIILNFPKLYFWMLDIACVKLGKGKLINLMQKKKFEFYL